MNRSSAPRIGDISPVRLLVSLTIVLCMMLSMVLPSYAIGGVNGNINGTVVDATTHKAVSGAKVTLAGPSGNYTATTDGGGHFTINGVSVDTYTLTIEAPGYDATQDRGVTIQGDSTVTLGNVTLSKALRTIGRTQTRSSSGAFQSGQTIDSYTVSGARVQEALGHADNTNENQLLLSVPGTSLTNTGTLTIRGGLQNEVGYQLNGVPFTEPFLTGNASNGRINGLGSAQVIEGAGDATQGNIGSGVIDIVPKRGTYPGTGLIDLEVGGPNFDHQFSVDYGVATRSGNVSNYFSYTGERNVPYQGYFNQNPAYLGTANNGPANFGQIGFFGASLLANDDLLDNFVFKFGKNNRQSIQALYNTRDLQSFGEVGGLTGRQYFLTDPYTQNIGGNPFPEVAGAPLNATQLYQQYTGTTPYYGGNGTVPYNLTNSQVISNNPTKLLTFEYDNNIDDKTFFVARYYNFSGLQTSNSTYDSNTNPTTSTTGGQRVGGNAELTHTLGQHTLTLQAQYEVQKPIWNQYAPVETLQVLGAGINGLSVNDFLPAAYNGTAGNGYVYDQIGQSRLPSVGIDYNNTTFQTSGIGIRDQFALNQAVKFDFGVRADHADYKYGHNPYNNTSTGYTNPSDVDPSFITNQVLHPTVIDPRFAVSLQPTPQDQFRFSYGRSVEFLNAQDAGTPGGLYNAQQLTALAPTPGTNTANPSTWNCGSGLNTSRNLPSGANVSSKGGGFFRCQNYAQQLYWAYDQNFDAPDLGNGTSPQYSNLDLSYAHQFKNGFGVKATGFYRRSTGEPGFFLLSQKIDPATGTILYQIFSVNNNAIIKTPGLEFELTTPQRAYGFSGYLSATYQNSLSSVPPLVPSEDTLPLVTTQSFQLGNLYRAGFLSPVVIDIGGTYKTKGGLKVTPGIEFNDGYPTGTGRYVAYNGYINGAAANVLQTNLGGSQPTLNGFNGTTGQSGASQYIDPAYPGSIINPNIAATRGEKETASAGGELTNPSFTANLDVEYTFGKRNTIGLAVNNLFGTVYAGSIPIPNTYYQPVTTGVAGPATGKPVQANPAQTAYANHGFINIPNSSYGQNPFILLPNQPTTYRVYYQLGL